MEVIEHKKTGILSETDAHDLRKNILELVHNDKLRQELGENARQFIVNNYSLQKQINKEIEIYESFV